MNAPHPLTTCRRCRAAANRSAPRTRSSCSPKSTRSREGQGHRLVLHRPARFPDAAQHPGRGDRGHPRRQARLHAVGRHRRAARRRRARPRRAARPRHPARRRRRRRGRQAVHRLHDRVGHRLRRRRRGDLSGARVSDLRVADRRQRRRAGADLPARGARLRVRSGRARSEDHAEDAAADPQLAAQPDRRRAAARGSRRDRRDPVARIRRSGCSPTRSIRGSIYDGAFDSLAHARRACSSARSSPTARRRPGR